ncbi:unnamed protein product [Durusdinium trenchii]|uniref:Uncharacterized protein n=2 Tax=Durusdinium trenchii TaxID=1381693 RepID=A0ABP0MXU3_9DINO
MALSHSLCALPRRPRCFVRTKSTQQSILSAAARGDAEGIYLALKHHELSPISVATAAHRLAKLRPLRASNTLRQRGLRELQAPILAAHTDFGAQATANTVWALAVLRSTDEIVWESLSHRASQQVQQFSGRHLSNLAWSVAILSRSDAPLLMMLSCEVMQKVKEMSPQSLANILWSFAFLAIWDSEMLRPSLDAVHTSAPAFNSRDLSNTLWALSLYRGSETDGFDWKRLLVSLANVAKVQAEGGLHPNDLTSIAWAFVDATPLQMHWLQRAAASPSKDQNTWATEPTEPQRPASYEPLD